MVDSRSSQSEKVALCERIKELTCLYDIAQIASQSNKSLEYILQGIVKVLPSAWQYPETTLARLVLGGVSYTTSDFPTNCQKQSADVFVNGKPKGFIEIGYAEQKPDLDEGPDIRFENLILQVKVLVLQE